MTPDEDLTPEEVAAVNAENTVLAQAVSEYLMQLQPLAFPDHETGRLPEGRALAMVMATLTDLLGGVLAMASAVQPENPSAASELMHQTMMRLIKVHSIYQTNERGPNIVDI